ncbi:MAG: RdgB/HAM1 family non-canonical purine NTP pyrophosphatase [Myxococcota bacterium]
MKTLRIATGNTGKLREFSQLLEPLGYQVLGLDDLGSIEIIEDGKTFRDNAIKKASTIMYHTGELTLADDSGLVVHALGGEPGVHSARYAGVTGPEQDRGNRLKLLQAMEDIPAQQRQAHFVCALALCAPGQEPRVFEETFEGSIGFAESGEHGFGYDAIFVVKGDTRTSAQLDPQEKNRLSHRGKALRKLLTYLHEEQRNP